jgi:hypothetical protein
VGITVGPSASSVGYVGSLFNNVGENKLAQQQFEDQLQQQQMAQQWAAHQQSIAAQLFGQQQHYQAMGQQQWLEMQRQAQLAAQHGAIQQGLQKQAFENNQQLQAQQQLSFENRQRMGLYASEMDNITALEKAGYQYSDAQQKEIDKLEDDRHALKTDPAVDPKAFAQAEQQFYAQRSKIKPEKPAPKTPQQILESSVAKYTFPDGTEVPGIMGERNGVPHFNPIENPKQKQDEKLDLLNQKLQHDEAKHQQDIAFKQAQSEQTLHAKALDAEFKRKQSVYGAWEKMRTNSIAFRQKAMAGVKGSFDKSAIEQAKTMADDFDKMTRENFIEHYGEEFANLEPEHAANMGIQVQPRQAVPQQQSQPAPAAPMPAPVQPPVPQPPPAAAPAIPQPSVDPWNQMHKQQMDQLPPDQRSQFMVPQVPGTPTPKEQAVIKYFKGFPAPASQKEYDALPKGAKYWDINDGKVYTKG